jgi:hypothetical protein
MPDITMCASDTCRRRTECYRNAASGTEPSPWRQAYFISTDMNEDGCEKFSPQDTKKYVKENNDRKEV